MNRLICTTGLAVMSRFILLRLHHHTRATEG